MELSERLTHEHLIEIKGMSSSVIGLKSVVEKLSGEFPEALGFKKMRKDNQEYRAGTNMIVKADVRADGHGLTAPPFQREVPRGNRNRQVDDQEALHETHNGSKRSAARGQYIMGEIICFLAPSTEVTTTNMAASSFIEYKGPCCDVLLRRHPLDLYGGAYLVPSSAVEPLDKRTKSTILIRERQRAPERLDVSFDSPIKGQGTVADPYTVRADGCMPERIVKPINKVSALEALHQRRQILMCTQSQHPATSLSCESLINTVAHHQLTLTLNLVFASLGE